MGDSLTDHEPKGEEPNLEIIRRAGWAIRVAYGRYCVAWRGRDEEVVLAWRKGTWEQVTGRGRWRDAA